MAEYDACSSMWVEMSNKCNLCQDEHTLTGTKSKKL